MHFPVIVVGPTDHQDFEALVARITASDVMVAEAKPEDSLLEILKIHPKAVIVVFDRCQTSARRVLQSVVAAHRSTPVLVVVEHSEFGQYYDLMANGARYYFEIGEGPQRIAEAVKWAAETCAT